MALVAVLALAVSPKTAEAQGAGNFSCTVNKAGKVSWDDQGADKYWIYRSLDGGNTFDWLGRTLGDLFIKDRSYNQDAKYQVHYQGIPRTDCTSTTPPVDKPPAEKPAFTCTVKNGKVSWADHGADKYWVYRSLDGGTTFDWLGRTLGKLSLRDRSGSNDAKYQVHYSGIPRTDCTDTGTEYPSTPKPFSCTVENGKVTWDDHGADKYWVYRSLDGGSTFSWLGRTLGDTKLRDGSYDQDAKYQVHYQGIPRVECTADKHDRFGNLFDLFDLWGDH